MYILNKHKDKYRRMCKYAYTITTYKTLYQENKCCVRILQMRQALQRSQYNSEAINVIADLPVDYYLYVGINH